MRNDTSTIRWPATAAVVSISLLCGCTLDNPLRGPESDLSVADAPAPNVTDASVPDAAEPDAHPPIVLSLRPCITFNPQDGLDLGEVEVGGTKQSDGLYVESCGGDTRLDAVGMAQGSHASITLAEESLPSFPVVMPGIEEGEAPPRRHFTVVCRPTEVGTVTGFAQILSEDVTHPVLGVAVTCTGVEPGTGPDAGPDIGVAETPDAAVPDALPQDGAEPNPDAASPEPDAAPPEPDAMGLGCLERPRDCPANTICDADTRQCIPDCFGIICTGATPYCIPPHPPFNVPACGQCLNDFSCAEGWHCNLADQMCNINE